MGKLCVVVLTAFVALNSVTAENRDSIPGRRSKTTLVNRVSHVSPRNSWHEVNLDVSRRPAPLDAAASYIANLVDDVAVTPSGSGSKSDLRIKPWISGRNGVGVKVELCW